MNININNINELQNDELDNLIATLIKEQARRRTERQKAAWQKVVDSLRDYCKDYEGIEIRDYDYSVALGRNFVSDEFGQITQE